MAAKQAKLNTTDNDTDGRWIHQPTIKQAAMHAIPFPDFSEGYVGLAVYELNQDQTARIVDDEVQA